MSQSRQRDLSLRNMTQHYLTRLAMLATAIREMNGKYIKGRPIKVKRSDWKDRDKKEVTKKKKKEVKRKRDLGLN